MSVRVAVQATPQDRGSWAELAVAVEAADGQARLIVSDEGAGLQPYEVERAFRRFWRGGHDRHGSGLGLPIAKSLVELHGGTFALKSKLRIGTEVVVTFPSERVMSALAPILEPAPPIQPQPQAPAESQPTAQKPDWRKRMFGASS